MATAVDGRAWEIGRQLKAIRESRGLSVDEAAEAAQLNPDHVREIEDNAGGVKHRGASVRVLERLANVYGRTVAIAPHPDMLDRV